MGRQRRVAIAAGFLTLISTGSVWACQQCGMAVVWNAFRFLVPWCLLIPLWAVAVGVAWRLDQSEGGKLGFRAVVRPVYLLILWAVILTVFAGQGLMVGFAWVWIMVKRLSIPHHRTRWMLRVNKLFVGLAVVSALFAYPVVPFWEHEAWTRAVVSRIKGKMRDAQATLPLDVTGQVVELEEFTVWDKMPLRAFPIDTGCLFFSCGPGRNWPEEEEIKSWVAENPDPEQTPMVTTLYNATNGTRSDGLILRWVPAEE